MRWTLRFVFMDKHTLTYIRSCIEVFMPFWKFDWIKSEFINTDIRFAFWFESNIITVIFRTVMLPRP